MGTDIHSVLEVKSNGKWLGVGHDLTTEHFDIDKECPKMKAKFPVGKMKDDWRGYIFDGEDYESAIRELLRRKKEGKLKLCPIELLENDYKAFKCGHKPWKETKVEPFEWRNYSYFMALSGCRALEGEIEPIAYPKGLPDDMSDFMRLYAGWYEFYDEPEKKNEWGEVMTYGDYHHASWLTIPEIEEWLKDPASHARDLGLKEVMEKYVAKWLSGTVVEMKKFLSLTNIEDVRVIFGFDS